MAGHTVKLNCWVDLAPQLFVKVAVAVQVVALVPVLVSLMVCSRDEPDVPQPLHAHVPPDTGCGPSTTVEPVFSEAEDLTAHVVVPLMLMYGVVVLGWHVCAHAGALSAARVSSTLFLISIVLLLSMCGPGLSGPSRSGAGGPGFNGRPSLKPLECSV
jgi:hypothetical protein